MVRNFVEISFSYRKECGKEVCKQTYTSRSTLTSFKQDILFLDTLNNFQVEKNTTFDDIQVSHVLKIDLKLYS